MHLMSKLAAGALTLAVVCSAATAQTNPTPRAVPFSESFGAVGSSTPPAGFAAWNGLNGGVIDTQPEAESSAPTGDAVISTATPTTAGGSYYFSAAGDALIAVQQSSSTTNGVNHWVLAINTVGQTNLVLSYEMSTTVGAATRQAEVVLQFRIGNAGAWTSIAGTRYTATQGAAAQVFNIPLDVSLENQPEVQFRWTNWRTGSGASSGFGIDDVAVQQAAAILGACCLPDGSCNATTATNCASINGVYQGDNTLCANVTCPQPLGSCCVNGACTDMVSAGDCASVMGIWTANGTCASNPCSGACCLPNGTCEVRNFDNCGSQGGVYRGDGVSCMNQACVFQCCIPGTGACQLLSIDACTQAGGTPNTTFTTCTEFACPFDLLPGACCVAGNCSSQLPADCATAGGIWLGRGTTCNANSCTPASGPTLVAKYDFDVNRQATSFTTAIEAMISPPYPDRDLFNVAQRYLASPDPLDSNLLDSSVTLFAPGANTPGDLQGIIRESKVDSFFAIVDTFGVIMLTDTLDATATWTFDVTGRTNLSVSFDAAAMGDFEATGAPNDRFTITAQIDAGPEVDIFRARTNEMAQNEYKMASNSVNPANGLIILQDPIIDQISTQLVDNTFKTFTANIAGTGATLTLRLKAQTNGQDEAFALDNIMVMADAIIVTPTGACCLPDNSCTPAVTADFCTLTLGGTYQGDNSLCSVGLCTPVLPCPGDFDGNRVVEVADIFSFLNAWFAQFGVCASGCSADIDGMGGVQVADIFAFLNQWFGQFGTPCP